MVFVLGAVIVGIDVQSIVSYRSPAGSQQSMTLGQVAALILGAGLVVIGGLVLSTIVRRRLDTRRRRRLRDRLEAREFGDD